MFRLRIEQIQSIVVKKSTKLSNSNLSYLCLTRGSRFNPVLDMLASFKKGNIGGVKVHVDRLQVCGFDRNLVMIISLLVLNHSLGVQHLTINT